MPQKGFKQDYSNLAGDSKYPIKPGVVVKLLKPWHRINHEIGNHVKVDHTVYIWIQIRGVWIKNIQPRDQRFFVNYLYQPTLQGCEKKYFNKRRKMKKISIVRVLHDNGFEIIAEDVKYNYTKEAWHKFYRRIGFQAL